MELWQIIVTTCAGIITLLTFFDKIGLTKSIKSIDGNIKDFKELMKDVGSLETELGTIVHLQKSHTDALTAMLRNSLYRCFKEYRNIAAWTDDECRVQTVLHEAYKALGGNAEEDIWWNQKTQWKILTDDEVESLRFHEIESYHGKLINYHGQFLK